MGWWKNYVRKIFWQRKADLRVKELLDSLPEEYVENMIDSMRGRIYE